MNHVHITAQLRSLDHRALVEIAKNRGIHLNVLTARILEWAGEKSVEELVGLGVRLPFYPGEFEQQDAADK